MYTDIQYKLYTFSSAVSSSDTYVCVCVYVYLMYFSFLLSVFLWILKLVDCDVGAFRKLADRLRGDEDELPQMLTLGKCHKHVH